jgi:acid phosphatase family membrane protein YuiD
VEGELESFWGSVEIMFFVYALAAVVSFLVAWVIKLIFAVIQKRKARADARAEAGNAAPEGAD